MFGLPNIVLQFLFFHTIKKKEVNAYQAKTNVDRKKNKKEQKRNVYRIIVAENRRSLLTAWSKRKTIDLVFVFCFPCGYSGNIRKLKTKRKKVKVENTNKKKGKEKKCSLRWTKVKFSADTITFQKHNRTWKQKSNKKVK